MRFEVRSVATDALNGSAIRKEIAIHFSGDADGPRMDLLLYLPKGRRQVPVFLGLNYYGNQSIHSDPGITISQK